MGLIGSKIINMKSISVVPFNNPLVNKNIKSDENKAIDIIKAKRQAIKQSQKCRYIANNKFKCLFLLTIIIFIIYLIYYEIPIDGSYKENGTIVNNFFSIFGYISINIFVVLLLTILGVETFMIKDELRNLSNEEIYTKEEIEETIKKIQQLPKQLEQVQIFKNINLSNILSKAVSKIKNTLKSFKKGSSDNKNSNNTLIKEFDLNLSELINQYNREKNDITIGLYASKYDNEKSLELTNKLDTLNKYYNNIFKDIYNMFKL
jgi:hypothetical protein